MPEKIDELYFDIRGNLKPLDADLRLAEQKIKQKNIMVRVGMDFKQADREIDQFVRRATAKLNIVGKVSLNTSNAEQKISQLEARLGRLGVGTSGGAVPIPATSGVTSTIGSFAGAAAGAAFFARPNNTVVKLRQTYGVPDPTAPSPSRISVAMDDVVTALRARTMTTSAAEHFRPKSMFLNPAVFGNLILSRGGRVYDPHSGLEVDTTAPHGSIEANTAALGGRFGRQVRAMPPIAPENMYPTDPMFMDITGGLASRGYSYLNRIGRGSAWAGVGKLANAGRYWAEQPVSNPAIANMFTNAMRNMGLPTKIGGMGLTVTNGAVVGGGVLMGATMLGGAAYREQQGAANLYAQQRGLEFNPTAQQLNAKAIYSAGQYATTSSTTGNILRKTGNAISAYIPSPIWNAGQGIRGLVGLETEADIMRDIADMQVEEQKREHKFNDKVMRQRSKRRGEIMSIENKVLNSDDMYQNVLDTAEAQATALEKDADMFTPGRTNEEVDAMRARATAIRNKAQRDVNRAKKIASETSASSVRQFNLSGVNDREGTREGIRQKYIGRLNSGTPQEVAEAKAEMEAELAAEERNYQAENKFRTMEGKTDYFGSRGMNYEADINAADAAYARETYGLDPSDPMQQERIRQAEERRANSKLRAEKARVMELSGERTDFLTARGENYRAGWEAADERFKANTMGLNANVPAEAAKIAREEQIRNNERVRLNRGSQINSNAMNDATRWANVSMLGAGTRGPNGQLLTVGALEQERQSAIYAADKSDPRAVADINRQYDQKVQAAKIDDARRAAYVGIGTRGINMENRRLDMQMEGHGIAAGIQSDIDSARQELSALELDTNMTPEEKKTRRESIMANMEKKVKLVSANFKNSLQGQDFSFLESAGGTDPRALKEMEDIRGIEAQLTKGKAEIASDTLNPNPQADASGAITAQQGQQIIDWLKKVAENVGVK